MVQSSKATRLIMRVQARPGSPVEARYYRYPEGRWEQLDPEAIAPGIPPDTSADLVFHGGKTVPQMEFQNVFLGGASIVARLRHRLDQYRDHARDAGSKAEQCRQAIL